MSRSRGIASEEVAKRGPDPLAYAALMSKTIKIIEAGEEMERILSEILLSSQLELMHPRIRAAIATWNKGRK